MDYKETFSPVIKAITIRVVIALATMHHWPMHQLDVSNVFLYGHVKEHLYMSQPPDYIDTTHPTYLYKLHKSLYGLK